MCLKILRYRAAAIGSTVQFQPVNSPSAGTAAICSVPESTSSFNEKTNP
jgi:hypothetical protein